MKKSYLLALCVAAASATASGANVTVTMNAISPTMTLVNKATDETVNVGEPTSNVYTFEAAAGTYVLTGIAKDGATINGTIELNITDADNQEFTLYTPTLYTTTKVNGNALVLGTDFTVDVQVNTNTGVPEVVTIGKSVTANRATFLALKGDSYIATFTPGETLQQADYMAVVKTGTITMNSSISATFTQGVDYVVTIPEGAELVLGQRYTSYIDFATVSPISVESVDDGVKYTYHLPTGQVFNYRTWRTGGLTQAGYFTMNASEAKRPAISFTEDDYKLYSPKQVNHSASSNNGYETGDIFVNVNPQGYLQLALGQEFESRPIRTWQITDTTTANYFFDPDYHYTVIDLDGNPSEGVIEIDNADTTSSPWSRIKAVGEGTVIVLVTYDAIECMNYSASTGAMTAPVGGDFWGAIWPENTAAYVVTVGGAQCAVKPNMTLNAGRNTSATKNAVDMVDAEHDVFYYLQSEGGAEYTFTPEGAVAVDIARPIIGANAATYAGFTTEGVTLNEDGSYTLLLKEGRQIVRLTDANGVATYQVLTAKPCTLELTNLTREDATDFRPGEQLTVQFGGLFHPANKCAGIYNMSAGVTFLDADSQLSVVSGKNQYLFGNTPAAQAVTVTIPEDLNADDNVELSLGSGNVFISGYGDPIGNHRLINSTIGRAANFTAVYITAYFGSLPEVVIPVTVNPSSGVDAVAIDGQASVIGYYDINGRSLAAPCSGVTIVRYSDGTTAKLLRR